MKIEKLVPMPFEEAINAFDSLKTMTPADYAALEEEAKSKAFTVSRISKLDIINDIYQAMKQAIEEGTPIREFQQNIEEVYRNKGWEDIESRSPYRIQNIYRTNIQKMYNAGRYRQQTDPEITSSRPYWQYDAINDSKTRPSHRALDGVVKRYDDPFWDTYYPPNGFQCRCSVRSRSARDLDRMDLEVTDYKPTVSPDRGWQTNPAKDIWKPDLDKYPDELSQKYKNEKESR